jgi:D-glycerate 3-kinase
MGREAGISIEGRNRVKATLASADIQGFLDMHRLPASYAEDIETYFLPLAAWLADQRSNGGTLVVGVNGAQGTGKSTLGDFLAMAVAAQFGWNAAVLSIDDFYLTRDERAALADDEHPLLMTRGVPGTHDVALLERTLDALCSLEEGQHFAPPRFDKSIDDRAPPPWPAINGPVDLIVLEGWCIGTPPQDEAALRKPANELERRRDPDGHWRRWVNDRLRSEYVPVWQRLDALVYLQAPGFDAIFRWRLEQETKLAAAAGPGASGIMNADEVREFISYYERLTRQALETLPIAADVSFELDTDHSVKAARYR